MSQLLILFGDNDFSYLGRRILEVMKEDIDFDDVTKEWVVKYWNTLAHPMYMCAQLDFNPMPNPTWLLITEKKVLLGKEVSIFLEENYQRMANYEWFMLSSNDGGHNFEVTVI